MISHDMIGPLGWLFVLSTVILAVALYLNQIAAARREQAWESQVKALRETLAEERTRPERMTFPLGTAKRISQGFKAEDLRTRGRL